MKNLYIPLLLAVFFTTMFFSRNAFAANGISILEEGGIQLHVFVSKLENFAVTSILLEGKKDAILINAQFSKEEAQRVVDMIKKTEKNLTTIYISHHDPDFYFGLAHIADYFPEAKIYSTPQTAYLIDATKESKLDIWGPQLKENAPSRFIVPEPISNSYFMLEDTRIEVMQKRDNPDFSYLWIPSLRIVLGGTYLYDKLHVWMADVRFTETPEKWIKTLNDMEALNPKYAIPGHFIKEKSNLHGSESIRFTKEYIINFERKKEISKNSKQLVTAMKALYPNLDGEHILDIGAKVRTGEMEWKKIDSFPPIARKAEVKVGNNIFELDFKDNKHMSFIGKAGDFKGVADDVEYKAVWIAGGIYMVYWSEPVVKANVVHVEDFNTGTVYSNISLKDGAFINLKGSITLLE